MEKKKLGIIFEEDVEKKTKMTKIIIGSVIGVTIVAGIVIASIWKHNKTRIIYTK
jgi:hypothetical protein